MFFFSLWLFVLKFCFALVILISNIVIKVSFKIVNKYFNIFIQNENERCVLENIL